VGRLIACISYFFVCGKVLTDVCEWIRMYTQCCKVDGSGDKSDEKGISI
jgi:hypothetical protein